jgi:hypothetical protein
MKANVLRPPKNPTATQMRNIKPDSIRMLTRRPNNRMWLHPGVVGENDNCQHTHTQTRITEMIKYDIPQQPRSVTTFADLNCIQCVKTQG